MFPFDFISNPILSLFGFYFIGVIYSHFIFTLSHFIYIHVQISFLMLSSLYLYYFIPLYFQSPLSFYNKFTFILLSFQVLKCTILLYIQFDSYLLSIHHNVYSHLIWFHWFHSIINFIPDHPIPEQEYNRTAQNRTEQNRTEQNRTEQNRTEQNSTEQNKGTGQDRTEQKEGHRTVQDKE